MKVDHPPPSHPPKEKEKQKRKGRPPKVGDANEKRKPKAEKHKHANQDGTKPVRKEGWSFVKIRVIADSSVRQFSYCFEF